jgi:PEP-CTERM motif
MNPQKNPGKQLTKILSLFVFTALAVTSAFAGGVDNSGGFGNNIVPEPGTCSLALLGGGLLLALKRRYQNRGK